MFELILKRCLSGIPLLILLSLLTFSLLRALPGDPIEVFIGSAERDLTREQKQSMRQELGLDKTLPEQYLYWLKECGRGNLGRSYKDGRPVTGLIAERLLPTFALVGTALLMSLTIGTLWATLMVWVTYVRSFAAGRECLLLSAYVLYSTPSFWLGFLSIAALASLGLPQLHLLGVHAPGQTGLRLDTLIVPALVLASRRAAKFALILRSSMLAELNKDYLLAARSRGMSMIGAVLFHASKNSLAPTINLVALSVPALIGGSVLVESVFAWPGMGRLAVEATFARNYPVLLALTLIYGTLVLVANLIADLAQMAVDPRLKEQMNSNKVSLVLRGP